MNDEMCIEDYKRILNAKDLQIECLINDNYDLKKKLYSSGADWSNAKR